MAPVAAFHDVCGRRIVGQPSAIAANDERVPPGAASGTHPALAPLTPGEGDRQGAVHVGGYACARRPPAGTRTERDGRTLPRTGAS